MWCLISEWKGEGEGGEGEEGRDGMGEMGGEGERIEGGMITNTTFNVS